MLVHSRPARPKSLRCMLIAVALVGTATPAGAQIYSWRDARGQLVVSNMRPPAGVEIKSYAVPKAPAIRATRYATAERGRVYEELISEHSHRNSVRPDLVRAVIQVESAFNPRARSPKGA